MKLYLICLVFTFLHLSRQRACGLRILSKSNEVKPRGSGRSGDNLLGLTKGPDPNPKGYNMRNEDGYPQPGFQSQFSEQHPGMEPDGMEQEYVSDDEEMRDDETPQQPNANPTTSIPTTTAKASTTTEKPKWGKRPVSNNNKRRKPGDEVDKDKMKMRYSSSEKVKEMEEGFIHPHSHLEMEEGKQRFPQSEDAERGDPGASKQGSLGWAFEGKPNMEFFNMHLKRHEVPDAHRMGKPHRTGSADIETSSSQKEHSGSLLSSGLANFHTNSRHNSKNSQEVGMSGGRKSSMNSAKGNGFSKPSSHSLSQSKQNEADLANNYPSSQEAKFPSFPPFFGGISFPQLNPWGSLWNADPSMRNGPQDMGNGMGPFPQDADQATSEQSEQDAAASGSSTFSTLYPTPWSQNMKEQGGAGSWGALAYNPSWKSGNSNYYAAMATYQNPAYMLQQVQNLSPLLIYHYLLGLSHGMSMYPNQMSSMLPSVNPAMQYSPMGGAASTAWGNNGFSSGNSHFAPPNMQQSSYGTNHPMMNPMNPYFMSPHAVKPESGHQQSPDSPPSKSENNKVHMNAQQPSQDNTQASTQSRSGHPESHFWQ